MCQTAVKICEIFGQNSRAKGEYRCFCSNFLRFLAVFRYIWPWKVRILMFSANSDLKFGFRGAKLPQKYVF